MVLPEIITIKRSDRDDWIRKSAILSTLVSSIEDGLIQDFDDVKEYLKRMGMGIEVKDADS